MTVSGRIQRNRAALDRDLGGGALRRYASPVLFGIEKALARQIRQHVSGTVLDAGCGFGPYRRLLEAAADRYESLDVRRGMEDQTYVTDLQTMADVPSDHFDAVICSEVLEHLPRPADALAQIHRVLKPGGVLIVTVPYLSRLHDEPHDYYRYTRHGLRHLLASAGLQGVEIERIGSLFSFFGHQLTTLGVAGTWHLPVVRWIALVLSAILVTLPAHFLDRVLGSDRLPLGYIAVARRAGRDA